MNDFDPIERLVQFGLGMGIAQQMAQTMNAAMQQMSIPGQQVYPDVPTSHKWNVVIEDKVCGQYADSEIEQLLRKKRITKDTFVWHPGMTSWKHLEDVPELYKLFIAISSPL